MELITKILLIIVFLSLIVFYAIILTRLELLQKKILFFEKNIDQLITKKNRIIKIREDIVEADKELEEIYENTVHTIKGMAESKPKEDNKQKKRIKDMIKNRKR